MKQILLAFLMILTVLMTNACATRPQYRSEWQIDTSNKAEYDAFMTVYNDCKDFAYKAKIAGSKYAQDDIHTSCIQQKGYWFKNIRIN